MEEMGRCRIKICGLSRPEDIAYVNEALPDYCGFIINFPKSHRNVTPDKVRSLVRGLDKRICPVGVFVDQPLETVLSLAADGTLGAVQLHGSETQEYVEELKNRLEKAAKEKLENRSEKTAEERPEDRLEKTAEEGLKKAAKEKLEKRPEKTADREISEEREKSGRIPVIQAFAIRTAEDIVRAGNSAADYILLDRGTGTGQMFDWSLIQGVNRPFFLAGGLGPDNLAEAVRQMRPFAADMSSGVETEKVKDREKILKAVNIVRGCTFPCPAAERGTL